MEPNESELFTNFNTEEAVDAKVKELVNEILQKESAVQVVSTLQPKPSTGWIGNPPAKRKWIYKKNISEPIEVKEKKDSYDTNVETYAFVPSSAGNLITSFAVSGQGDNTHSAVGSTQLPVIDLDVPAVLIPSSTPGHSHLYIDHEVSSYDYYVLLSALTEAGIIEEGYFDFYKNAGYTAVRAPGVMKHGVSNGVGDIIRQNAELRRRNHALLAEMEHYKGLVVNETAGD